MLGSLFLSGQNLRMTFTASGASGNVDSVKATNLRTNENVTLPGQDTLYLSLNIGIDELKDRSGQGYAFPNPFQGRTTFVTYIPHAQTVTLGIYSLSGQLVAREQAFVQKGNNAFYLSLNRTGVYLISLSSDMGTTGCKVICTGPDGSGDWIRYAGVTDGTGSPRLKSTTIYTLGYSQGDIVLYRCRGGIHTTIITDWPDASKNYTVEFVPCTDPDGKSYAIVKIGNQYWMAENLAWLPKVSASGIGSDSLPYYYVYGYEDSVVSAAKNTTNYKMHGVLYNWPAAMTASKKTSIVPGMARGACPAGWHVPEDEEWKVLEKSLGMTQADADTLYLRNSGEVGKKLKSTQGWQVNDNGINMSGFTGLPAGYRNLHGGFKNIGSSAIFWTATQSDTASWYRNLNALDSGVYRLATLRDHGLSVRCIKD